MTLTTDQLIEQATACFRSALAEESESIMSGLSNSANGKYSFSCGIKLNKSETRVYMSGKLSHSTKSTSDFEGSFSIDDPDQLKLEDQP